MTHHWRELKVGTKYYKIHKCFRNYPSSSFTRLHNLTLCHFHKYRDLSNGVVTCHASPRPAPPFSLPSLLNTFFLQTTLNSICRSNESEEKKGIDFQLNFIDQILPSLLGERAFFPSKSHADPSPPTCYVLVWWTPVLWKFLFLHWFYFKNWEILVPPVKQIDC